jgi:2,3-bisphosphoglycerate-independent phosphoglycerate mutase
MVTAMAIVIAVMAKVSSLCFVHDAPCGSTQKITINEPKSQGIEYPVYLLYNLLTMSIKKSALNPPFFLIILDGFGLCDPKILGNAITPKTAPHIFDYIKKYPSTELLAHGEAVGLFPDQEGNSEAGHFNIGAGRVVEQDIVTIQKEIQDGRFFKNLALHKAIEHAKKNKSALHLMGLLTDGQSAHAHPEHLYAILEMLKSEKDISVYLHLFTDGRDSSPHSAVSYIRELRKHLGENQQIASIMGRLYAMDRGKNWDRTEVAYNVLTLDEGKYMATSAEAAVEHGYNRGETDEYLAPTIIAHKGKALCEIRNDDSIIFFNCRSDRARQLTKAFVQKDFEEENPDSFKREKKLKNISFVALTDFGPDLPGILTAFPSPDVKNCLAKAIGENRRQLYISETEKYAHVTYFLNGGFPKAINGEVRELVHSTEVQSYAKKPEMNIKKVVKRIFKYLAMDRFDFYCVNFPNADMVGHTGDFEATKLAITAVDRSVQRIVDAVLRRGGTVVITADHGNAEEMIDPVTGEHFTEHSTNPVPFVVVQGDLRGEKIQKIGKLADVAPTVLKLLGIKKPTEMTGKSLL